MANDIIVHMRISENANPDLYNLLTNSKKKSQKIIELANIGLKAEKSNLEDTVNDIKQDMFLLKQNMIAMQTQFNNGALGNASPPTTIKQDNLTKEETEKDHRDMINITEDTNAPISSEAMHDLMALLNP